MRILLVSADADLRVALQILLREEPLHDVVATVSSFAAAISVITTDKPDLLVLDWDLPSDDAAAIVSQSRQLDHPPRIVVIGVHESDQAAARLAGASAFTTKEESPDHLLNAILAVGKEIPDDR